MNDQRLNSQQDAQVDALIDTWRDWDLGLNDRPTVVEPVPGGRTNRNYRLNAPGLSDDLLLRINHPDPERLGIDRNREKAILDRIAETDITRPYWHWDTRQRFVVSPYLPGRTWTAADFEDGDQRERLWPMLERLHAVEVDGPKRRYHDYISDYWQQLEQSGRVNAELETAWHAFEPRLKAFDRAPWQSCLVHHDLIPENILETADRLYIIDWEYAAPGHPDIDTWTIDPSTVGEPFVAEMMGWINGLWERLVRDRPFTER